MDVVEVPAAVQGREAMTTTAIVGNKGSGKTLLATYISKLSTKPVISNYKITHPTWEPMNLSRLLKDERPSLVVLDEGYSEIDSRVSTTSKTNRIWSHLNFQARKDDRDFIVTVQLFSSIDLRFRDLLEYIVLCERKKDGFHYEIHQQSSVRPRMKRLFLSNKDAEKIFPYYNSWQKIPLDPDLVAAAEPLEDKMPKVIALSNEISGDVSSINKAAIKGWLQRHNESITYADPIFNELTYRKSSSTTIPL